MSTDTVAGSLSPLLAETAPELARVLRRSALLTPPRFAVAQIDVRTELVTMRDGVRLATDVWLPPQLPAPVVAMRTPYGRGADPIAGAFLSFARRGYAVVSQDVRGTGDSEPDTWDYYMYEPDDGYDLVEWIVRQDWCDGFVGACGGSYVGQTQWQMALHPAMSTIVPEVSGLGVAVNTAHLYLFLDAYARVVGKGEGKVALHLTEMEDHVAAETLAGGYFNEPLYQPVPEPLLRRYPQLRDLSPGERQRRLWDLYCAMSGAERAAFVRLATGSPAVTTVDVESLPSVFGQRISHDAHTLPHPDPAELARSFHAPVLLRTGWYDWGLNDALATWDLLMRAAPEPVRSGSRLFVAPSAHNQPGYHEGMAEHPELHHAYGTPTNAETLLRWYDAVREGRTDEWPAVVYYLMGANEWRSADAWPVPGARTVALHLGPRGTLTTGAPGAATGPDRYVYDPDDPTPTVGGSIVSYRYPPGSVDVSAVQRRADVLTYTTDVLPDDVDVVGPLRLVLYAASSAVDTDFVARLSDVFPDGRAIQLQSGLLRARYRDLDGEPELLEPGRVYRLEIDMCATANRFAAGHRIRLDISSADFPKYDRNANRGGEPGPPVPAEQLVHHDPEYPSHLLLPVVAGRL
ncbi:CocE/NonD family hydrolase [Jiangella anatolica]|uniref:Xaa-Pro dipeptidyl-peptidase C-terminal domain-containing protein n=1 Tax=Jiangella anatolica TaxID=2670374 RepID=A0A2W2BWA8_9ACTN|nr:CocE/NonD family hydrolase [Jiangella anatolica]PZF84714.1 hypothetical protein C1I92_07555 [Jiangella anatolica]